MNDLDRVNNATNVEPERPQNMNAFMKQNKRDTSKEIEIAVTDAFLDSNGEPIKWKLRSVTSKVYQEIIDKCTSKKGNLDIGKFTKMLAVKSVVFPDLKNAELQDSYGVFSEYDLLDAMLSEFREYDNLLTIATKLNESTSIEEQIDQVKNF